MVTRLSIKNFKKLGNISFDLDQSVVIIGPNNSGKSTIFQALSLWETGVTLFLQAIQKSDLNTKGYITINRRDLLNSPIADARFLWKNKNVTQKNAKGGGVEHIPLTVEVSGSTNGKEWQCKAEFTFSNAESLTCRITEGLKEIKEVFRTGNGIRFRFLQPMSGLSSAEDKLTQGSIDRKLGEGRTAEVLRNICYEILYPETQPLVPIDGEKNWMRFVTHLKNIFGVTLHKPEFIRATGIIQLEYTENRIRYDVSSGGRGFLQTLLLLAYMYSNPGTIMLLDEPDAHLEVIRQREIFKLLSAVAEEVGSQIMIASHSEVILNEAVENSKVVALIENTILDINTRSAKENVRNVSDPWWSDEKLTDNWLDKIIPQFYEKVGLPQAIWKRDYHEIIATMKPEEVDPEVKVKLDALLPVLS